MLAFAAAACTDGDAERPIDTLPSPYTVNTIPEPAGPLPATCHSAYWPCVPRSEDVDCAGGPGDGPRFVAGPIDVITSDPYDLDDDGDGIACER
ncbi:MAG TPA: hypothetical protein VHG93_04000 [Longimicrobium sp.]|nr:hypothetical protein [Longimicrobium sp.]